MSATARACSNIALVKYWGKRDAALNLPAAGSLSLTLAGLVTETTVELSERLVADSLVLNSVSVDPRRTTQFLDLIRKRAGITTRARVTSTNDFPTASGLASSASGYAALAVAAAAAAGLDLSPLDLSLLARRGSGSAARSIFGGLVRMHAGDRDEDAYAEPLAWPLVDRVRMVIAVVGGGVPKAHGSTSAMDHTAATSPYYAAWRDEVVPRDLAAATAALVALDLAALGEVAEANALAMHASAIAARPAVLYWQPATIALLAEVRALRARGVVAWATIDAGPHVKVLTTADDARVVAAAVREVDGVTSVITSAAGAGATLVTRA